MKSESFMFSVLGDHWSEIDWSLSFFLTQHSVDFGKYFCPMTVLNNIMYNSTYNLFFTSEHHFETASLMEINVWIVEHSSNNSCYQKCQPYGLEGNRAAIYGS